MIVNFVDDQGNTLHLNAESFIEAYKKAIALNFYVYDFDIEEE